MSVGKSPLSRRAAHFNRIIEPPPRYSRGRNNARTVCSGHKFFTSGNAMLFYIVILLYESGNINVAAATLTCYMGYIVSESQHIIYLPRAHVSQTSNRKTVSVYVTPCIWICVCLSIRLFFIVYLACGLFFWTFITTLLQSVEL